MKHPYVSQRYWTSIATPMGESKDLSKRFDDVIDLSLGDPDLTTDERIIQGAFADAQAGHTHYTATLGDPELLTAIRAFHNDTYGTVVEDAGIMVTTSGCHAMWLVLESILNDEEEVIIHAPYFTPYPQQIRLARGKTVVLDTREEDLFQIDPFRLEALITPRTKALILNTPNNPTGACFSRGTLEAIRDVAVRHNLLVIADDIYTIYNYGRTPFVPISTLEGMEDRTITIRSFSKDFCMTGWRIGYVLAPPAIIETMRHVNENSVFTAPSISQRAALHALKHRSSIQPLYTAQFQRRAETAYARIRTIPKLSVLEPRGGMYLFLNIRATGLSSKEAAARILEEAHVLLIPGNAFGDAGEGYLRLALTVDETALHAAFDRIQTMPLFQP